MARERTYHHRGGRREGKRPLSQREQLDRDTERQQFLRGLVEDFAALRNNPAAWREEQAERAAWDCTLADGLEDA